MAAPTGPPAAVPAAICAAAFPPSTLALTVAAAALEVASAPFFAVSFAAAIGILAGQQGGDAIPSERFPIIQ